MYIIERYHVHVPEKRNFLNFLHANRDMMVGGFEIWHLHGLKVYTYLYSEQWKKKLSHSILYFPTSFEHRPVFEGGIFKNTYLYHYSEYQDVPFFGTHGQSRTFQKNCQEIQNICNVKGKIINYIMTDQCSNHIYHPQLHRVSYMTSDKLP